MQKIEGVTSESILSNNELVFEVQAEQSNLKGNRYKLTLFA